MPVRRVSIVALLVLAGCASQPEPKPEPVPQQRSGRVIDVEIYRRAENQRAERLEREVQRLRGDLRAAEDALVATESGLRGNHSRADAVSSLAEARIQVERAIEDAPWRTEPIAEALEKLAEADRQIEEGHFGAALFFVYRARRTADQLSVEGRVVSGTPGALFVGARRANLRSGPSLLDPVIRTLTRGTPVFPEDAEGQWSLVRAVSGPVGWIHTDLLSGSGAPGPANAN